MAILLLAGVSLYVARELFLGRPTAYMNSMHGFWMALARVPVSAWFWPAWWRFWDGGMPLEYAYPPLVPLLTKAIGFQATTGLAYVLGPVALFALCYALSRSAGYSLAAAAGYALFGQPQRLYLAAVWDETPHLLSTSCAMLALAGMARGSSKARATLWAAAALAANAFGLTFLALGGVCLVMALGMRVWRAVASSLALACLGACAWMPPSLFAVIAKVNQTYPEGRISAASAAAWACLALAAGLAWWVLWRTRADAALRFFAPWSLAVAVVVVAWARFGVVVLPQPGRYSVELQLALAGLVAFAGRRLLERFSREVRAAVAITLVLAAAAQTIEHRRFAKAILKPADPSQTLEHELALWCARNLAGERVMLPGSLSMWANAFADVEQFGGGSFSTALNTSQQAALLEVLQGKDLAASIRWLQAYGVTAVAVPGHDSPEFWKAVTHPEKFDGRLGLLWRDRDTTVYRVPAAEGLARLERWRWMNEVEVRVPAAGAVVVPVNFHRGWSAAVPLQRDELGRIVLQSAQAGPLVLRYRGGFELQAVHVVSPIVLFGLVLAAARKKGSFSVNTAAQATRG